MKSNEMTMCAQLDQFIAERERVAPGAGKLLEITMRAYAVKYDTAATSLYTFMSAGLVRLQANGGFTAILERGKGGRFLDAPENGRYVVGGVDPTKLATCYSPDGMGVKELEEGILTALPLDLDSHTYTYIGAWQSPGGAVEIEQVSLHYALQHALNTAYARHQTAIWDLKNHQLILVQDPR